MLKYCKKYKRDVLTEADCYKCPEEEEKDGYYTCRFYNNNKWKKL